MTASSLFAALTGAGLLLSSTAAFAESDPPQHLRPGAFSLRIETGAAIPLGAPQATTFGVGLSQTIKGMWALNRYFELGPSVTFIGLPKLGSTTALGTAWSVGPELAVQIAARFA